MTPDPKSESAAVRKSPGGLAMLLIFPAFAVLITLAVAGVGITDGWLTVFGAMAAVVALTGVVWVLTARLLADDRD